MAFFGGEEVSVGVSSTKLLEEYPNIIGDAVITAIMEPGSIADYLLVAMLNGFNGKTEDYLDYGKTDYIFGLPTASAGIIVADIDAVQTAIGDLIGQPVTVHIALISEPKYEYFVYEDLQATWNWRYKTNSVPIFHPEFGTLYYTYISYSVIDGYILSVILKAIDGEGYTITLTHNIAAPPQKLFYHVKYTVDSLENDDFLFTTYDPSTHIIPELDIDEVSVPDAEFFPIAPVLLDGVPIKDKPYPEGYDEFYPSVSTLLTKVDLSLDEIVDAVMGNPDIEDISDAWILFGAPLHSTVPETIEYLFWLFYDLFQSSPVDYGTYWEARNNVVEPPYNSFVVQEQVYNTEIRYDYITYATYDGNFGATGSYETFVRKRDNTIIPVYHGDEIPTLYTYTNSYIIFRQQKTDTVIREIRVYGLLHISKVMVGGTLNNPDYMSSYHYIEDKPENQVGFFIPIENRQLQKHNNLKQSYIMYDSLQIVIYSEVVTTLPWYAGSGFVTLVQIVMTFVGAIIGATAIGAAIAKGLTSILTTIVKMVAVYVLTDFIVKLLIENVGLEAAFLVAIIGSIALSSLGGPGILSLNGMPLAETLMKAVTAAIKVLKTNVQLEFAGLEEDYKEFLQTKEENDEALEYAEDMTNATLLNTLHARQFNLMMDPDETPNAFFNRSIHTGNPGVASLDATHVYIENMLKLPEIDDLAILGTNNDTLIA